MTWKRSLRQLPAQIFIALLLSEIMAGIVFGAQKLLDKEELYERQEVAVVLEDGGRMMKLAVRFIQQMESVNTACRFNMMNRTDAVQALEAGEIIAALVVPENVFDGIMNGTNVPVEVYLPRDATFESLVFEELLASGASLLTTAQAEIYAVYDLASLADALQNINQYQNEIDEWNLELALHREKAFRTQEVSVLGQVSLPAFYGASAGILLCLLYGIGSTFLRLERTAATGQQLCRAGVGVWGQHLSLLLVQTGWLSIIQIFFYQAGRKGLSMEFLGWELVSALLIASLQLLVYTVFREQTGTTVFLVLCSVGMLFVSGGFIPSVFLPAGFERIAPFLPSTWLLRLQSGLLSNGTVQDGAEMIFPLLLFIVGFIICGVVIRWRRLDGRVR